MSPDALLVIAKEPLPGRAKTRLTPPCTPEQAANLAAAALADTLDTVARTPVGRRVLVFDGDPTAWSRPGFEVIRQRGEGLGERLAAAFADVGSPGLLVGMDTPQLTPRLLRGGLDALRRPGIDAVLGPTLDGGYWGIGFRSPPIGAFAGVPMSHPHTYAHQSLRLRELGLRIHGQPLLRDVDTIEDAHAVARIAPRSQFAQALSRI